MSEITALTRQKRNPDRINVFLDGEFAFGLAAIAAATLKIGQQLTPAEITNLEQLDLLEKAKQSAFKFLSYRPRSGFEVEKNLRGKGYEQGIIDQVIARLQELDLLDDVAFAAYWVEQRETFKPRSAMVLRQELMQKGIARHIIDDVVSTIDETAAARKAAESRLSRWQELPREAFEKKLGGYLQRRGFNYGIVRQITNELWDELSHDH
ncbi:MAG: hypothetical protein GY943_15225 [Chloroflexi bacterium]|nr:hypothetical protein [Chloroflexota bacterium]